VVEDITGGDTEAIMLTETGSDTAIFRALLDLQESASSTDQNGILEAVDGDTVRLQYTDPANSTDTSTADAAIVSTPSEILLMLAKSGTTANLSWTGAPGPYEVRRSEDPVFTVYDTFTPNGGPSGTTYDDPDFPSSGDIFFYLVESL